MLELLEYDCLKIMHYSSYERKECIIHSEQLSTTRISESYLTEIIEDEFQSIPEQRFMFQNDNETVLNTYVL